MLGNTPWTSKREIKKHLKIENEIYSGLKYCMGRTDWDRRVMKALAPEAKYYFCQEILRTPFYNAIWSPTNNNKYIFYTTIREDYYKNVDIIYETCDILEKYNRNLNFEWNVAGINKEDISPQIMRHRKINPRNLKLLGSLNANEIINEMLRANIFIYPSAIENSSNAVEEAMLLGIPIIASFAGGMNTIIEDKKTGCLVNEGDPYVLAGAIIEMLENYDEAIKMGKKAREVALVRHEPQNVIDSLLNIYNCVLSNKL